MLNVVALSHESGAAHFFLKKYSQILCYIMKNYYFCSITKK
nr:MAG TPA: hypothetical protein [Bacteriophage sp.]